MTTAAERRQEVLDRAWDRRRRQAAEREQQPLRKALCVGGTIGVVVGLVLGQLFFVSELAGPAISAVLGLALGVLGGAGFVYQREWAAEQEVRRADAQARAEERVRRREEARRERREKKDGKRLGAAAVVEAAAIEADELDDDEFIVPPGFYPDPGGGSKHRYWDGASWTDELAA
jgi:hypothetical protein